MVVHPGAAHQRDVVEAAAPTPSPAPVSEAPAPSALPQIGEPRPSSARYLTPKSAVAAAEALQRDAIAAAFQSPQATLRSSTSTGGLLIDAEVQTTKKKSRTRSTSGRKTIKLRRQVPTALRTAKQQDRIADDYYEILRHLK